MLAALVAAAIALPGAPQELHLDDLFYARSLGMLVVPAAETRSIYLVAADGSVTRVSPFPPAGPGGRLASALVTGGRDGAGRPPQLGHGRAPTAQPADGPFADAS